MCHQTHLAIWTITDFITFVQQKNSQMINYENISNKNVTLYLDLYQQNNSNKS